MWHLNLTFVVLIIYLYLNAKYKLNNHVNDTGKRLIPLQ